MAAQPTAAGWILRMGSTAGIVGALLGLVGNLLRPATPTGDPEGVAHAIADTNSGSPITLAIVLGLILVLGGLVAIARSIQGGVPGALARLGSVTAVAGVTVGLNLVTLDGLAAKQLAEAGQPRHRRNKRPRCGWSWPRRPSLRPGALVNILFAGVIFILYGLAVAWSQLYPRWLGWVVVRAGLGLVAAGLIQASAGEATTVTRTLTIIFPTVITLWLIQMGILAFRKAPSTEGAIAESFEAAVQAHRSGPARRCRRSKKAAWAAVQPTMSTAGTASGHLGMPRTG